MLDKIKAEIKRCFHFYNVSQKYTLKSSTAKTFLKKQSLRFWLHPPTKIPISWSSIYLIIHSDHFWSSVHMLARNVRICIHSRATITAH